jgi:hypothetical protein
MLPQAYELPAALFLFLAGAVSCFAGYRLFKLVLGIYGFILGAGLASSAMSASNTIGMIAAALAGGIVGALILVFAYFIGIALVGAGLGALVLHFGWHYGRMAARPAPSQSVWILYPTAASTAKWVPIAWVALGVVGAAVQLGITGRKS